LGQELRRRNVQLPLLAHPEPRQLQRQLHLYASPTLANCILCLGTHEAWIDWGDGSGEQQLTVDADRYMAVPTCAP
jgi:hypothetical protein